MPKNKFISSTYASWKPLNDWSAQFKAKKLKGINGFFTINYFYIYGTPAWYFSRSLKEISYSGPIGFSGYMQEDDDGKPIRLFSTIAYIGEPPAADILKETLIRGKKNEVLEKIQYLDGKKNIYNGKGVIQFDAGFRAVITSAWSSNFVADCSHICAALRKRGLVTGDIVRFSAVGNPRKERHQRGNGFQLGYTWCATWVENWGTAEPKSLMGRNFQDSNKSNKKYNSCGNVHKLSLPKCDGKMKPKSNWKKKQTAHAAEFGGAEAEDSSSDSSDDSFVSISSTATADADLLARLERLNEVAYEACELSREVPKTKIKNITSQTDKSVKTKNKWVQTDTKTFVDTGVQTMSTGDVTYHKMHLGLTFNNPIPSGP